jgi:translation initiation factor IF-2
VDEREAELEALRTRVANQAASLAETVTQGFEEFRMGAGDYRVELMTPEGPSTGGGVQARQHLRLVPRRKGYAVVVAGNVDPVTSTAEIRTYEHVALLYELRFARPLEITPDEYEDFLRKTDVVLNLARVRSRRVGPPPEAVAHRRAMGKISLPMLAIFTLVILLAAFVAYRVAVVLRGG